LPPKLPGWPSVVYASWTSSSDARPIAVKLFGTALFLFAFLFRDIWNGSIFRDRALVVAVFNDVFSQSTAARASASSTWFYLDIGATQPHIGVIFRDRRVRCF